jgi:hypothetical protein
MFAVNEKSAAIAGDLDRIASDVASLRQLMDILNHAGGIGRFEEDKLTEAFEKISAATATASAALRDIEPRVRCFIRQADQQRHQRPRVAEAV